MTRRTDLVDAYLRRLGEEARRVADRVEVAPDTTYLGGGTPSLLGVRELGVLFGQLRAVFGGLGDEVTLEAHPATVTPEAVAAWRDAGVTRLSIGVQSFDDTVLARLGRDHDARQAHAAVDAAVAVGGWSVSVDLITAVEGQDVAADLVAAAASGVDHVSAYTLTIEPGTPFDRRGVTVCDAAEADALDAATAILGGVGLGRYEVSNHARPGSACRHNLAYWRSEWWVGLGPSAAGHEPSVSGGLADRTVNPRLGDWLDGGEPVREVRDPLGWVEDALVAGLRMVEGVDLEELSARSGLEVGRLLAAEVDALVAEGLVSVAGGRLAATPRGMTVLDTVTARLVPLPPPPR